MAKLGKLDRKLLQMVNDSKAIEHMAYVSQGFTNAPIVLCSFLIDYNILAYPAFTILFNHDYPGETDRLVKAKKMVAYAMKETLQYVNGMKPKLFSGRDVSTKRQNLSCSTINVLGYRLAEVTKIYDTTLSGKKLILYGYEYNSRGAKFMTPVANIVIGRGLGIDEISKTFNQYKDRS